MIKDVYGNSRFYGIYRGVVYGVDDPLSKNRIRVQVPQLLADYPTQWCWPVGVVGTALPEVGDGVWIQFEGGDPAFPVWSGSFNENLVTASSTSAPSIIDGGSA
jgi:hypothetical protein